jgi:putative ABC transport system permease protein
MNSPSRWPTMARVGLAMMFHDKLKMIGTLTGVVFAVVLSNQQAGTFLGLMHKNVMFIKNAGADLWIVPPATEALQPGKLMSDAPLSQARVTRGVAWAEPLLYGAATMSLPTGGSQPVTIIGTTSPRYSGGPWNLVRGDSEVLRSPDTMIFEDADRELYGNLNFGGVRELNGRRIIAGGFTFGLIPFGPSFSFADFDLARELLRVPSDQTHYVLVGAEPGADVDAIKRELIQRSPDTLVFTRSEFEGATIKYILTRTAIGITLGTSAVFGLLIGFVIVSLSMFSAVVDNIREFGTLKAIGATTMDLAKLLFVQAVAYASMGSLIGLALVTRVAEGIRSAKLALQLPWQLLVGTSVLMVFMCVFASSLALLRLRKVEPGMVFR